MVLLSRQSRSRRQRAFTIADRMARDIDRWTRSGSVKTAEVPVHAMTAVRLTNKRRCARMRITPNLVTGVRYNVSVEILSPTTNADKYVGVLTINDKRFGSVGDGFWRKTVGTINGGEEMIIEAKSPDGSFTSGDLCYVNLHSLRIWV